MSYSSFFYNTPTIYLSVVFSLSFHSVTQPFPSSYRIRTKSITHQAKCKNRTGAKFRILNLTCFLYCELKFVPCMEVEYLEWTWCISNSKTSVLNLIHSRSLSHRKIGKLTAFKEYNLERNIRKSLPDKVTKKRVSINVVLK